MLLNVATSDSFTYKIQIPNLIFTLYISNVILGWNSFDPIKVSIISSIKFK